MRKVTIHPAVLLIAASLAGCGEAAAGCGIASAYTPGSATRVEPYNHMVISAAHQSLPLGTRVIVRNQRKGRSIVVKIADRSPSLLGRIIDLSTDAMNALGIDALAPVCVEVVSYGSGSRGFRRITVRNPMAEVKHAGVRQHMNASSAALSAHVTGRAKSAHVRSGNAKRHAQALRRNQQVRRLARRRLAAHS
ncbi:MAG: septal ring lytic transglycosylase RlpA family protein [Rhodomicrobium sp.]